MCPIAVLTPPSLHPHPLCSCMAPLEVRVSSQSHHPPQENVDPLDKDPDEEAAKLLEEEEKRKQAEEEAKWKAEQGEDEEGDKDDDEG